MRLAPGLWSAAAALSIVGLVLRVVPTALPTPNVAPSEPPPPAPAPPAVAGRAPSTDDGIVSATVFAPSRSAPRTRFTPPGVKAARPRAEPALRLYGITITGEGALALIDADPRIPGAELYRVGDLAGGARVTAITDSTVTLAQPSGPRVLRLRPAPRRKS